ncbi:hypothetical protein HPT25_27190 [Bacillus sp. BRMEA1]|uniref:hypothetical protein n=1 Tax=Neobacillus endophyticus TaxID=2738405 RepID=UPI0015671EFF|nr:hypothetical protein [Neobacillus endophyticus]NRD81009.1 hypothetical protein [Neobacillus endophyticus]
MRKEEYKKQLLKHKEHITTVRNWDVYAREHGLPSSHLLITAFESWKKVKEEIGIKEVDREKELINIASNHKNHFTTVNNWNNYAREHNLPNAFTYISHFDSWNSAKEKLNLSPTSPYPSKEEKKEEMIAVLKEHGSQYIDRTEWDKYAKTHNLPTYKTIRNYLTFEEVKAIIPKEIKYNYSKQELIQIARAHFEHFSSMGKWNQYAKENGLPNATTFYRKFGTWKQAKIEVFQK